jgi:hypothetical protein
VWTGAVIPDLVEYPRKEQMIFFELFSLQQKRELGVACHGRPRLSHCAPEMATAVPHGT